jgi:hypothetical protein
VLAGVSASRTAIGCGHFKVAAPLAVELQRLGEKRNGFALRAAAVSALERAHSIGAHPRALGEYFLRKTGGQPVFF